jgi:hypothetical protein
MNYSTKNSAVCSQNMRKDRGFRIFGAQWLSESPYAPFLFPYHSKNWLACKRFLISLVKKPDCRMDSLEIPPHFGVTTQLIYRCLQSLVMLVCAGRSITPSECFESSTLLTLLPCRLFHQQCGHPQQSAMKSSWEKSAGTIVQQVYRENAQSVRLSARSVHTHPLPSFFQKTSRLRLISPLPSESDSLFSRLLIRRGSTGDWCESGSLMSRSNFASAPACFKSCQAL